MRKVLILLILTLSLTCCNKAPDHSIQSDELQETASEPNQFSKKNDQTSEVVNSISESVSYFTDEPLQLSPEDEMKKNEKIPLDWWEGTNEGGEVNSYFSALNCIYKCFDKPLEEVTFEDVWRFNNNHEPVVIGIHGDYSTPRLLQELRNVKSIDIYAEAFPTYQWDSLFDMTWLEEVECHGSNIYMHDELPESISKLSNLKKLNFIAHPIVELPDIFESLPSLENVSFSYCNIETLPPSFYTLSNLKVLKLDGNQVTSLSGDIANMSRLEELYLDIPLEEIPDEICELQNLRVLEFMYYNKKNPNSPGKNRTITLPENIGNLKNLKRLAIDNVILSSLPDSFGNLESLKELVIKVDANMELPASFKNLKNVNHLVINGNKNLQAQAEKLLGIEE